MTRYNRNPCFPVCPPDDDDFDFIFPCETSTRKVQCRSEKVDSEMYLKSLRAEICELEQRRNEICELEQRRNEICELEQRRDCLAKLKADYCAKLKDKVDLCETSKSKEDGSDSKKTCIVEINGKSYELTEADDQTKPKPDKPPCAFTITPVPVKEEPPPCPQVPVVVVMSDNGNPLADVEARKRLVVTQAQNLSSFTIPQYDNLIQQIINLLVDVVDVEGCGSQIQCKKEKIMKELREMLISVKEKKAQQVKLDAIQKDFNDKHAQLQNQLNNAQNNANNKQTQLQSQLDDLKNKLANCCNTLPPPQAPAPCIPC